MRGNLTWAAVIISIALIISTVLFTRTWHNNYKMNQTISVTGSATRQITSDLGYLRGSIIAEGPDANLAYQSLEKQKPILINYLNSKGFDQSSVKFYTVNSYQREKLDEKGQPTGEILKVHYNQRIEIKSADVNLIHQISLEIPSLIEKGVHFNVEPPQYYYTQLDSLKVSIQADAAKNAMKRAQHIAESTRRQLGVLTGSDMGVLQITPINSNQVSNYGINDASTIEKEITGVIHATFMIQ